MAKDLKLPRGSGQTPLDDLSGLLVSIRTREELNDLEAKNNAKAYTKYLLLLKSSSKFNLFSTASLCGIHKDMFRDVWSWAGEFRKGGATNIGVPTAQIGAEIHRLLSDADQWEEKKMAPEEIAARIHHRLVFIHPFENGNGRWSRLVTNLYLHRKERPLIEWPSDQKLVREVFKPRYLAALKKADVGEYDALFELHREYTKG